MNDQKFLFLNIDNYIDNACGACFFKSILLFAETTVMVQLLHNPYDRSLITWKRLKQNTAPYFSYL